MSHKDIHAAILAVMQAVGYVKKTKSVGLNYSFAGEAALIAALRPELVEHGIYCYVEDIADYQTREYTSARGSAMVDVTLQAFVRFVHAASGTSIRVAARGEGSDTGDKAASKAMTGAYKYALRQTFLIETGDDPDKYASEERRPSQAQTGTEKQIQERGDDPQPGGKTAKAERPLAPERLKELLAQKSVRMAKDAEARTIETVAATLEQILGGEGQRRELTAWLVGSPSLKKVPGNVIHALASWLKPVYDPEGQRYTFDPMSATEAHTAHTFALEAAGQIPLDGARVPQGGAHVALEGEQEG